jgi:branched-chain amino acid transport system ATP-binding protein
MLTVSDIHTYYGDSYIIQGVSLSVLRGRITVLMGRNGAGKTTVIRSIAGLTPPRRGSILFGGEELTRLPAHEIARRGIGLVPQGRRIFASLSVGEHLAVAASRRREATWTTDRIFTIFPRLKERLRQRAAHLSGGEQSMLAIARALRTEPECLLMDEPTEGLAPVLVEALTAVLAQLRAESALSIVLVEQNSRVALTFSARTVILDKGHIVYDGETEPLRNDPERLAKLIGIVE